MKDKTEKAAALDAGLSTLDSRRHRLVYVLTAPFLLSVIGAWAWFNTDIGARPSTLDTLRAFGLWCGPTSPATLFIPEPVSESVMKGSERRTS